jgi:putative DNA primase/helicase
MAHIDDVNRLVRKYGFLVLPVARAGKNPLIKDWPDLATHDHQQLRDWWLQWPDANIGIATGSRAGLIAVDVDGPEGLASLGELERQIPELRRTLTSRTGSGGIHLLYRTPQGMQFGNSTKRLAPGIDIRAERGQIVAPPSLHSSGRLYEWVNDLPIAPIPNCLIGLLSGERSSSPSVAMRAEGGLGSLMQKGSRNNGLIQLVGFLRQKGVNADEITRIAHITNNEAEEPLDPDEIESVLRSGLAYMEGLDFTEQGFAASLARILHITTAFSSSMGWMAYDDGRWQRDPEGLSVQHDVMEHLDDLRERISGHARLDAEEKNAFLKAVSRFRRSGAIKGIAQLLKSHPHIRDEGDWDEHDNFINFENGTLKLPSLELHGHQPQDRLTKKLPYAYDPAATCPNFDRAVGDALGREEARFFQQLIGYSIVADGSLQHFVVLIGPARNGKSTIMEALVNAFGPYGTSVEPSSFMKRHNKSSINNDIAALRGKRLVSTSELNQGEMLDAALTKRMSGGGRMQARFLRQEFFEFKFKGLIVMDTNHHPIFDGSDAAIKRRIMVIDFPNTIDPAREDTALRGRVMREAPGIMNWVLAGYADYAANGLQIPPSVQAAKEAVLEDHNPVLEFLEERYSLDPEGNVGSRALYGDYRHWAESGGMKAMCIQAFGGAVQRCWKISRVKVKSGMIWRGIRRELSSFGP